MTEYRRYRVKGGSYFFTVNLAERKRKLLTEHIGILRDAFRTVKQAHPFQLDAIVILPDHLHALWTLPEGDDDFSLRWRQVKSAFSRAIEKGERVSLSRATKQERGIYPEGTSGRGGGFGSMPSVTIMILPGMSTISRHSCFADGEVFEPRRNPTNGACCPVRLECFPKACQQRNGYPQKAF